MKSGNRLELGRRAIDELVKLQSLPEEIWAEKTGFVPFGERLITWDLNYFKYDFLKPAGVVFNEDKLEDDFAKIKSRLLLTPEALWGFMYRDFQSRNLMIKDDKLWLIDYQGGRKGPIVYDIISFLWQAKAPFTFEEREALCSYYCEKISERRGIKVKEITKEIEPFALFRTLQVFGAYGFRGLIERKPHFIESLPGAQRNLKFLLEKGAIDPYPELKKISEKSVEIRFREEPDREELTLKVFSFSYKKGYPEDRSGNGGGFMFDCRGMHNPGRYEEYKSLTGKDEPVIRFLEERGETGQFIERAWEIVKPSIERYIERGFTSLQVGFGCTGGQHRSVYCAEKFAKKAREVFPKIVVELIHREQR